MVDAANPPGFAYAASRRNGRTLWLRDLTIATALLGEHVHYLDREGRVWCVTAQQAGILWARIGTTRRTNRPGPPLSA